MLSEMTKVNFDPSLTVYPMPVCLVGAEVRGRPNFMAVAWFSKVNYSPPMMMVALGKRQYTAEGIKENGAFSVNLPGEGLVAETDYCGTVSGRDEDKSRLFDVFYGELGKAPMIRECPVCFELELVETIELPRTLLFIGHIVAAYADEKQVNDDRVDIPGTRQFTLIESPSSLYLSLGGQVAEAYSVGKSLSKRAPPAST